MELNKMREMTDAELAAELEKMKKELFKILKLFKLIWKIIVF